ncbi:MAG: putative quorum-sensing-regulated virulence factor, partial [Akkermansiaceae bacterium]
MQILDVDREEFRQILAEIGELHMPFGRYGPERFPPLGIPVMDLPLEYLEWFRQKGFP